MSDIIVQENPFYSPICNNCVHRIEGLKCKAFNTIPDEILTGKNNHSKPLPFQKGDFVFKAK